MRSVKQQRDEHMSDEMTPAMEPAPNPSPSPNTTTALAKAQPLMPALAEWKQMQEMATVMAASGLFPALNTWQKCAVVALKGRELGIPMTQAAQQIHVIKGKATCAAELMLALVERDHGRGAFYVDMSESDDTQAVIMYRDPATGGYKRYVYTIEMARKAELLGNDNWRKFPANMLRWRAVSNVAKAVFPACVAGMYTHDEMGARLEFDTEGNADVITVDHRIIPDQEPPDREVYDGNPDSYYVRQADIDRSQDVRPISEPQIKRMFAIARERDWPNDALKGYLSHVFEYEHSSDIQRRDYDTIIAYIQSNPPWVDPRQQRLPMTEYASVEDYTEAVVRDLPDDPPATDEFDEIFPAGPTQPAPEPDSMTDWQGWMDGATSVKEWQEILEAAWVEGKLQLNASSEFSTRFWEKWHAWRRANDKHAKLVLPAPA